MNQKLLAVLPYATSRTAHEYFVTQSS